MWSVRQFLSNFCFVFYSLHNYSSIYGEFYCTSHYKQLFKDKGKYEGFGYKQKKDQLPEKNRGIDELDNVSGQKMTKSYLKMSDQSPESSVPTPKSLVKGAENASSADPPGKPKRIWPPEKKNTGFELVQQQTRIQTKTSGTLSGSNQPKSVDNGEVKTRVKVLSSPFIKKDQERAKTTPSDFIAEKIPSTEIRSDPPKTAPSPLLSSKENVVESRIKALHQKHEAPAPRPSDSPAPGRLDTDPNSGRKSVRFAPRLPGSQPEMSNQPGDKTWERKTDSDQTKRRSKEASDQSNGGLTSHEFRKGQEKKGEEYLEISKHESQRKADLKPKSGQEPDVRPETPEPDGKKMVEKSEEAAEEVGNDPEQAEATQVIPKGSGSPPESGTPVGHESGEEAGVEKNEDITENSQKKTTARTDSLRSSASQAEKTKGKLGTWPTGRSPLSKLFTSGGNDKTNKTEPKEARKPDVKAGLLGRLFQSSSEKAEDTTKSPVPKNTDEGKEIRKKETDDEGNKSDVSSPELKVEAGKRVTSTEGQTSENAKTVSGGSSSKAPALIQDSTAETKDQPTVVEQTNAANHQNLEVQNGEAGPSEPPSQEPEEKIDPSKLEPDGVQTEIFNEGFFNVSGGLASGEQLSPQVRTAESGPGPQLIGPSGAGGPDPGAGELPGPEFSSDLFGPLSSGGTLTLSGAAPATVNNHTPVLDFSQSEAPSDLQTEPQAANMDIFASNDILLFQSPADQKAADTSTNLVDDVFGDSLDVFASLPPNPGSGNLVGEPLGPAAAPLLQTALFSGDIFAPGEQTPAASQPGDHALFLDNLLMSDNTEPAAPSGVTGHSWMDDLLG